LFPEIHRRLNSVRNKEELTQMWKKSISIPICKKCDKTNYNNYRGIYTIYKILSIVLTSRLTIYVDEITGYHQCVFQRNRSTID